MIRSRYYLIAALLAGISFLCTRTLSGQAAGNLFWWFQGIENVECVASIGDQDGDGIADGIAEVVVMSYDAGAPAGDDLFLIKGNSEGYGEVIWSTKPYGGVSGGGGYGDQCLSTSPDMSGDGLEDILLGTAWGGRTAFAITGATGDILFEYDSYQHPPSGWCYAVNPIGDLNGDGIADVLAAFGNDTRAAFCYDGAGSGDATVLWKWDADNDGVESICSLGDVNGNGYPDALVGCGGNFIDNRVAAIEGASSGEPALTIWTYDTGSTVQDVSAIRDVNGNGIDAALAGGWSEGVYCIAGGSSGTGQVIWEHFLGTVIMKVEPIDDVNGDGIDDVIVGSWDNSITCLDGSTGTLLWSTPTGTLNGGDVWTVYPIADVDGDGIADVLAGSFDTKVYCASGATGNVIWTYTTGNRLYTVRSIPDVNGDGIEEAIAGTQMIGGSGGKAYCIEGDSQGPWVEITAAPDTSLIHAGDTLGVTVTLHNSTAFPQTFDAWMDVRTPWGSTIPLERAYGVTLPGGVTVSPRLEEAVPPVAPAGAYRVVVAVGTYGVSVMDSDSFEVEILNPAFREIGPGAVTGGWRSRGSLAAPANGWPGSTDRRSLGLAAAVRSNRLAEMERVSVKARETGRYLSWAVSTFGPHADRILAARMRGLGPGM
jgi:outer membrane protein assembly factor BamB